MAKTRISPIGYLSSVIEEGKKVIWPSRPTVIQHTVMVVVVMAIATIIVAGIDLGLQKLVLLALTHNGQ